MRKVLEIKLTQESPLEAKSLVQPLCDTTFNGFSEPLKNKSEFEADTFGQPEVEESCFQRNPDNNEISFLEAEIKHLQSIDNPSPDTLKKQMNLLEDLIVKKKEKDGESFLRLFKNNDDLKKVISKLKKEMNADKTNLKKIYEKRILELRKEENTLKTDAFNVKQRIYSLQLESNVTEKELEDLTEELRNLGQEKKSVCLNLESRNASVSKSIDELGQENKRLSLASQNFMSQLNSIFLST